MALSIIVVGTGPAGLACALTLARKGHQVHVLEQSSGLRTNGGDLTIRQNGTRLLLDWCLGERLKPFATNTNTVEFRRYKDLSLLGQNDPAPNLTLP